MRSNRAGIRRIRKLDSRHRVFEARNYAILRVSRIRATSARYTSKSSLMAVRKSGVGPISSVSGKRNCSQRKLRLLPSKSPLGGACTFHEIRPVYVLTSPSNCLHHARFNRWPLLGADALCSLALRRLLEASKRTDSCLCRDPRASIAENVPGRSVPNVPKTRKPWS